MSHALWKVMIRFQIQIGDQLFYLSYLLRTMLKVYLMRLYLAHRCPR